MYFQKIIAYIDYFEHGEKVKNAGHIRVIVQGEECTMDICIKGLHRTDSLSAPVQLIRESSEGLSGSRRDVRGLPGDGREGIKATQIVQTRSSSIGNIQLTQGIGNYMHTYNAADVDALGTSLEQICGLHIPIGQDRYCRAVWRECAETKDKNADIVNDDKETFPEERKKTEATESSKMQNIEKNITYEEENMAVTDKRNDTCVIMKTESSTESGQEKDNTPVTFEAVGKTEAEDSEKAEAEKEPEREAEKELLYPNKWQQLRHSYQTVHPFEQEDEFISIEPKDFVIMRQEYQNLVNNSFLLHGFYNYRHIILGRKKGNPQYYLGVPGTYYDREKMVAVMFGFEGFEASGEDNTDKEIEQGTFGYYMRRVDI